MTPKPRSDASAKKAPATKTAARKAPAKKTATKAAGGGGESFRARQLASSRFGIVYDIDGPRVRLGVVWFVAALIAVYLGSFVLAALVAAVAALAAAQTAQALRTKWRNPHLGVAAAIAGLVPLAAAVGLASSGLVIVVGTILAVFVAASSRPRRTDPLVDAGAVVRSAIFVGLAAASIVVLHRFDIGAAVVLILLVSAYETGDYLVGSGASNMVEGPMSGILTIAVVTVPVAVVQPPPFTAPGVWFYALVVAMTAPVGQVVASAILPRAGAPAPALRRLDSYVVAGPMWLVLLWSGVGI